MNEIEEGTWGDEDWENDTYEVGLWKCTLDWQLDWKCTMWAVVVDGGITDVDDAAVGKGAGICGGEDETVAIKQKKVKTDVVQFEVKL